MASIEENALQLTLKAMETGYILKNSSDISVTEANRFNAQAVNDFYKAMLKMQTSDTLKEYDSLYQ